MGNRYGDFYGYTGLFPVIDDPRGAESHLDVLREMLNRLDAGPGSMFARAGLVHGARLFLVDDIIDNGYPALPEHLPYAYLALSMTFDGPLERLAAALSATAAGDLAAIFDHCYGFRGAGTPEGLLSYLRAGQVTTTFLYVDAEAPLWRVLAALKVQAMSRDLVVQGQGASLAERRRLVDAFARAVRTLETDPPGGFAREHPGPWGAGYREAAE
jgi:hypothetical protein